MLEIGIDSFVARMADPATGATLSATDRMATLMDEVELADSVGLDVFGIGEHHRRDFLDASPAVILAAAAMRTKRIRLTSAVSVLGASDPVRLFQDFATVDLLSKGRAEIVVGRGSFAEAYPLFGYDLKDYDVLFAEKLDLLLQLRDQTHVSWSGRFRATLNGQGVFPRPHQPRIPIWLGVGGTAQSFARAGRLGLPLMVAVIGGDFRSFRSFVELYREAGRMAGHAEATLSVGLHAIGFVGETDTQAREAFYPGWFSMFASVGRERGWSPPTREQFEAMCAPQGAFLLGSPDTVRNKVLAAQAAFGGLARVTFQMSSASHDTQAMRRSIELLGEEVAPALREASIPSKISERQ